MFAGMISLSGAQSDPFGFSAASEGMDTLSGSSAGPSGETVGRVTDSLGGAVPPSGAPPIGSAPPTMASPGLEAYGMPVQEKTITVWVGERVYDAVTGVLLNDALKFILPEKEKVNFYDDGTHGDSMAGDGEYALITTNRNDYIGMQTNEFKLKTLRIISQINEMNPIQFFDALVASSELVSNLPNASDLESRRDTQLQSCTSYNRIVNNHKIIFTFSDSSVGYIVNVLNHIVPVFILSYKGSQFYIFYSYFFNPYCFIDYFCNCFS